MHARRKKRIREKAFKDYAIKDEWQRDASARVDALEAELGAVKAELDATRELADKYKAIAEPPMDYFFHGGSYSIEHDLAGLEAITSCHVSACQARPLRTMNHLITSSHHHRITSLPE